jgi:hypothetical protein
MTLTGVFLQSPRGAGRRKRVDGYQGEHHELGE